MRPEYFIILVLFKGNILFGNPDSLKAVGILESAINEIELKQSDVIEKNIDLAFSIFKQQDDLKNWLIWHNRVGRKYRKIRDYNKALFYFNKALDQPWRTYQNKEELVPIASITGMIGTINKKHLNNLYTAKTYYEKYKILCRDSLRRSEIFLARYVYNQLGNVYNGLRDEDKAMYYYNLAKEICLKHKNWNLYSQISRNQGLFYIDLEKYNEAQITYDGALVLKDSLSLYERINLFNAKGLGYYSSKDYQLATDYTYKSIELVNQHDQTIDPKDLEDHKYDICYNLGRIAKGQKQFEKAENYYLQALQIRRDGNSGNNKREQVTMINNLGRLFREKGDFDRSKSYFHQSIQLLSVELAAIDDPEEVPEKLLIGENQLAYIYSELGEVCIEEYKMNHSKDSLRKGIDYLKLSEKVNQIQVQKYPTELSDLKALARQRSLKEYLQYALFELNEVAPSVISRAKMFSISERSRSFLLLNQKIINQNLLRLSEEDRVSYETLVENRKTLEEAFYETQNSKDGLSALEVSEWRGEIIRANDAIQIFEEANKIGLSKKLNALKLLDNIQSVLDDDQALIEYFVGEEIMFIYLITQKNIKVYKETISDNYLVVLNEYLSHLLKYSTLGDSFTKSSCGLFNLLMRKPLNDLDPRINRLVIVKDQSLNLIPFEVFPSENCGNPNSATNKMYLLETYSISYAYSGQIFELQSRTTANRANYNFLGYAPSYPPEKIEAASVDSSSLIAFLVRSGQYELKGAKKEVTRVAKLLKGKAMFEEEATEANFKANANDHAVILLSMHGLVNLQQPNFSELLFDFGHDPISKEDNLLRPIEIYQMNLNADLIVLSACDTGNGKLYPGEGVFSFSRAFAAAGVPSTMMTLWKVDDRSTSQIVISFFEFLKKGMPKDIALQKAKLQYLEVNKNNKAALHPYFWAGLQLNGNTQALDLRNSMPLYLIILIILVLSTFLLIFLKKKA